MVPLVFTAIVAHRQPARRLQRRPAGLAHAAVVRDHRADRRAIGIALGLVLQPGVNAGVAVAAPRPRRPAGPGSDFLTGLIPSNLLGLDGPHQADRRRRHDLAVVQRAADRGHLASPSASPRCKVGEAAEPFLAFNASALAVVRKILWWVIRLTPIGTIGLFGNAVANYGWDALAQLGTFTVAVYVGLALVLFVVYPALLALNGLSVAVLRRRLAGHPAGLRVALLDRHAAGDPGA